MGSNYGGKVSNGNTYIKEFIYGPPNILWKTSTYLGSETPIPVITPSTDLYKNVYVPGDLYVDGVIVNPSDKYLKENIEELDSSITNKIMNLKPSQFSFKKDATSHIHYGFIAQDFEAHYPELISGMPDPNIANLKSINYLEIIPLLVSKVQIMQKEIDELKMELRNKNL